MRKWCHTYNSLHGFGFRHSDSIVVYFADAYLYLGIRFRTVKDIPVSSYSDEELFEMYYRIQPLKDKQLKDRQLLQDTKISNNYARIRLPKVNRKLIG